jgi:hypothetical protein
MNFLKCSIAVGVSLVAHAHADIAIPMTQLPYTNPEQARSMLVDVERGHFSYDRTLRLLDKYVPPQMNIVGHPRDWPAARGACTSFQTADHCKPALARVISAMEHKELLGLTKMRFIKTEKIPYSDPAPLLPLIQALDHANGYPTITPQETVAVLDPYLPANVVVDDRPGTGFSYSRSMCMFFSDPASRSWGAPFFVYCKDYAQQLVALMREKETAGKRVLVNPFGP